VVQVTGPEIKTPSRPRPHEQANPKNGGDDRLHASAIFASVIKIVVVTPGNDGRYLTAKTGTWLGATKGSSAVTSGSSNTKWLQSTKS
jgi:hypothetical protein